MTAFKSLIAVGLFALLLTACRRDDYLTGGTLHTRKYNMTTYDFLKSQSSGLFDTLILLVDKAGVKEMVNQQGTTFFAPTDYAINAYLSRRAVEEQIVDPFRKWTIDSLVKYELPKFRDSIAAYMVGEPLGYDQLTQNGKVFSTRKAGTQAVVSYEEIDPTNPEYTNLGGNPNVSSNPRLVYFAFLYRPLAPPVVANEITPEQGNRERVQTSGIETTTGILHVINNQHTLFFRQ